jgi:DNA-binding transcriptional MerR regulator/GGDEF domain-containing protein
MDERSVHRIQEHLQQEDVQRRIQRYMEKGHAEATVTISRAAELFNLSENRLRDWEEYGLLSPLRPTGPKGRRLYTPTELDKLAVIRELIDAGYAPSDIPPTIQLLWNAVSPHPIHSYYPSPISSGDVHPQDDLPINRRIEQAREEAFWRFYVSQTLRLALMLICQDLPNTNACLILPLEQARTLDTPPQRVEDLENLGESLVGLLDQNLASHTLWTMTPTFEYASDYRILSLAPMTEDVPEGLSHERTFILLDRRSRKLSLSAPLVETLSRLLAPLYAEAPRFRACFGPGTRDVIDIVPNLNDTLLGEDRTLKGICEMVVRLGGVAATGQPCWHYSCLLLPNYPPSILSLQQRALLIRAQSKHGPFKVGVTRFDPQDIATTPIVRAFQVGRILLQPIIPVLEEPGLGRLEEGERIRSAVAIPIMGREGIAIGVLYVASQQAEAFQERDLRVLRVIEIMLGSLLETYYARLLPLKGLRTSIEAPAVVDPFFQEFLSENEFASHVEELLYAIQGRKEFSMREVVSFIALDIDNMSSLASKYGDRMARDLSHEVGMRIQGQLRAFKDNAECELYRISADRFYIMLEGMPLEQAQAKAELLRTVLSGSYQIDPQRVPAGQPTLPANKVALNGITVRLGVSFYYYAKLQEILQRYMAHNALVEARLLIERFLDEVLDIAKREGGNVVMSWDPHQRGYVRLHGSLAAVVSVPPSPSISTS